MDLKLLRDKIDGIDSSLLPLFLERMRVSGEIAQLKMENGIPVFNEAREKEVLDAVRRSSGEECEYALSLFREIMALSKDRQRELLNGRIGLLGEHLSHSYSVEIHRELGIDDYRLFECEPENVAAFVHGGKLRGLNITIPYKKVVHSLCDTLSEAAQEIGCVNTVLFSQDGKINGYCTDACGFEYAINRSGVEVAGKKALILGSGGAALAVKYVLRKLGAKKIITVSRNGEDNYSNINKHTDAALLVNATPVGMFPSADENIVDLAGFSCLECVFDLIYNPLRSNLLLQAEKLGIPCENGLSMLVAQAKRSAELFTGENIPDSEISRILRLMNSRTCNIALIGMPGSGKSAIGEALSLMSGREVFDTDAQIVRKTGKSIPDIFSCEGEEAFRTYEREAVKEAENMKGKIIITGGGVVLSEDNRRSLKRNSRVYRVMRDVGRLERTGRPLSENGNLTELLNERDGLYAECCDALADNNSDSPYAAAAAILADFTQTL